MEILKSQIHDYASIVAGCNTSTQTILKWELRHPALKI